MSEVMVGADPGLRPESAPAGRSREPGRHHARETDAMGRRVSCPEFIGRAEELELLTSTYATIAGGAAATVLIGGDAGMGKTRLVDEFCAQARSDDALVASGVCVPIDGGGLPFAPVVGILRDMAAQLGEAATEAVLGPLASGLSLGAVSVADPIDAYSSAPRVADELAKTELFEAILLSCMRAAERHPLVLVFEDLQWADSGSAELLSFLTRNLNGNRVLLVGTYRSDELGGDHRLRPWLSELGRHARVISLRLDGLDRDEMAGLIGGILGQQPDWALVDAVSARSQGNPFFAEELTAARHSPTLSAELQGVIMTRVEALSDEAQQLVRIAATAGPTTDHRLLAAVGVLDTDASDDALDHALAEAVDKQVLVVDPTQEGYQFRHALLREAVSAALLPGVRRRLHLQVATALTADPSLGPAGPGHRAAELAAHWWAAGKWAEALEASMAAAKAATELWVFPEAHRHLERALSALGHLPAAELLSAADHLRLLEQASEVAYLAGAGQRSLDLAREAIARADSSVDPAGVARLHTLVGRNAWAIGDSETAFAAYRHAAALVPADSPSVVLARVLAEEARGLMLMSRFAEAELLCHDAIEVACAVGARAEEGHIRCTLGCCRSSLGHPDEGIALVREALAIAEELSSPDDLNRAYGNLSSLYIDAGRLEDAASLVFDNASVGEQLWGIRLNGAAGNSVDALIRLGRYDQADALLAQLGDHALGVCEPGPYLLPAATAIRRGRFEEAAELLVTADGLTAGMADVQQRGSFHMLSAELALEQGRPDDAYDHVERALALAAATDDETFRPEMCALAVRSLADALDAARSTGRRSDPHKARLLARGLVEETDRLLAAPGSRGGTSAPRAEAFGATCVAEQSRLDESDPDLWQEAARRWENLGEPYPAAYSRWREAEALLTSRTRRSRANDCLQRAWRTSVDLGVPPLRERIERLAQRARIPLLESEHTEVEPGRNLSTDFGLTQREVEVLGQLAAGRTDREIGESLFISKKTASVHVSNLLRKLDVANRMEAGKIGQAQGLG